MQLKTYTSISDGNVVAQGQAFVLNGIAYPYNWLDLASASDLAEHGIALTLSEAPAPQPEPEAPPLGIPKIYSITPRQARLALLGAGLLDDVEAAVNAAGDATKITWEYATEINRHDALIEAMGGRLGLTTDQIDNLFRAASEL